MEEKRTIHTLKELLEKAEDKNDPFDYHTSIKASGSRRVNLSSVWNTVGADCYFLSNRIAYITNKIWEIVG